jgi:transcriptional regulator with XRE-family HTH domain
MSEFVELQYLMRFLDIHLLDPVILGTRIRQARERLGMSQEELAEAVSKDQRAVSEYENGKRKLAATELPEFARVLNVPLMYFYEGAQNTEDFDQEFLAEFRRLPTSEAKHAAIAIVHILLETLRSRP